MAKHLKINSDEIVKTYSFKVMRCNNDIDKKLREAIAQQQNYYNLCSDWIKDNLTTKIGDLYKYIPEKKRNNAYATCLISEEWKDKPLYMMFKKGFSGNNRDNAIYEAIVANNPEKYNGNIFGFSETIYRRFGYVQSVTSNYVTKISKMSTGIKKKKLSDVPSFDEMAEQVIYEMEHNGWTSLNDWNQWFEYIESKEDTNHAIIKRMKDLREFYDGHRVEVDLMMEEKSIESLISFGGCHRNNSKQSMSLMCSSGTKFDIKKNDNRKSFNINIANAICVDVFGRKDVIDKDGNLLVDICKNHGDSIVIKIDNGKVYVDINTKVIFKKNISSVDKVVGVDVNIKHMLLATNIVDDGSVIGYVNIYKEVVNDKDFRKVSNVGIIKTFEELSKFVTFCPNEFELLFSRISKQRGFDSKDSEIEEAFTNVLYKLKKKYIDSGDNVKRIYIENVLKIRSQIKAYAVLKNVYYDKQSEYDLDNDKQIQFADTECGREIISKLNNISKTIIGCRNNIIQYSYRVFTDNGFTTIALENLTSSQFEKVKNLPSVKSLLNYHKILGCTEYEMMQKGVYSVIKKGYYDILFDGGKVVDAKLSDSGKMVKLKDDFFNLMIKSVHFADIKDYFITLSNNGSVGVSLVPSYFTSQMDSIDHKIYCKVDEKSNKLKLVDKRCVRKSQEEHINGLNADFNAANNIGYITSNKTFRDMFLRQTRTDKSLYDKPSYETTVKSQATMVEKMKKAKFVKILNV